MYDYNPSEFPSEKNDIISILSQGVRDPLRVAEHMFDVYLDSFQQSPLAMRLAQLMLVSDMYALRGYQDVALLCLKQAEPIVHRFLSWDTETIDPSSVSFFIECFIRNGSFDDARRVVAETCERLLSRDDVDPSDVTKSEQGWLHEISHEESLRAERLEKVANNEYLEPEYALPEKDGLESAITGYFELIGRLRQVA